MDSARHRWHVCGMTSADPILDWLRPLLPAGSALAAGPIGAPAPSPYPAEEAAVAWAVDKRRFEFRAGRAYARQALAELGGPNAAVGRGPGGDPIWPAGFTGSITHTDDLAAAVAARTGDVRAIGLDVEDDAPLETTLTGVVCRPDELAAAAAAGPPELDAAKRLLVCKEAFIKLNHSLTATLAELLDIGIELQPPTRAGQAFRATWAPRLAAARSSGCDGRLAWGGGRIAAVIYVS
jgi:4'-phosphopantetheinyl transferase EntD